MPRGEEISDHDSVAILTRIKERGTNGEITIQELKEIAEAFGVSLTSVQRARKFSGVKLKYSERSGNAKGKLQEIDLKLYALGNEIHSIKKEQENVSKWIVDLIKNLEKRVDNHKAHIDRLINKR